MNENRPRIPPSLAPRDGPVADEPRPEAPAPSAPPPESRPPRRIGRIVGRTLLWTFIALFVLALVPPGYVLWLRWHAPPTSAFMLQSEVQPVQYHFVPASQIPEPMRLAVVTSEDQKFYTHWGFDFIAIAEALEHNEKSKKKRGASTISQQTAKNLFLWPSRSWVRKGLEVTFTLLLEGLWPKDRILEVYLNIAEFGPGIYGVEAASQTYFHKPAADMTPTECARLAAVLPNPRKWHPDHPGPYVQSRVDWILGQLGYRPKEPEPEQVEIVPSEPQPEPEGGPEEGPEPETPPETPPSDAAPATPPPAPETTPAPGTTPAPAEPAPESPPPT